MIIISVPHSYCSSKFKRTCDTLALYGASCLYSQLDKMHHKTRVILIKSMIPRFMVDTLSEDRRPLDMNRKESRKTKFRVDLSKLLNSEPQFLLDIHSFPDDKVKVNSKGKLISLNADIAFISLDPEGEIYLKEIYRILSDKNINVKLLKGNHVNDIISEAKKLDVPYFLVEFNETLSKSKMKKICNIISSFVVEYIK